MMDNKFWAVLTAACASAVWADTPAVFWASSPVKPGEAVMVQGWGWGNQPKIELQRLKDGDADKPSDNTPPRIAETVTSSPILCNAEGLSFVVPQGWKPGLYRFSVVADTGRSQASDLNAPSPWWHQGDWGQEASPGGWLRIFGNSLSLGNKAVVALKGSAGTVLLQPSKQDSWALSVELPKDLKAGAYQLFVHNGCGGAAGWRAAENVTVAPHVPLWKNKAFDITAFGAVANDAIDDSDAVQKALDAAGAEGGGIVSIPRGRFQLNATLQIPRLVLLKGAGTNLSLLYWRDREEPLPTLIQGSNSFAVEDLTMLAANHGAGIVSDAADKPDAGTVFLRRLVLRLNRFEAQDTDAIAARLLPMGDGPFAVQVGGSNVQVTDCEIFSSYGPLHVTGTDTLVRGNRLFAGDSIYVLAGQRVVFEDNTLNGGPMARGGGVYCKQLYYARNRMGMTPRHDGEVFTTDGGGHTVVKAVALDGVRMTLDEAFAKQQPHWNGFENWWHEKKPGQPPCLYIMKGKGAGQYRWIVSHTGLACELDRPWTVEPDADSLIFFCVHNFDRNLLIGNDFHDATIIQSYASGTEWIVASNTFTRIGGIQIFTHYDEPAWRMQCLNNEILAGSNYRGPESAAFDRDAHLGLVSGGGRCTVFRNNTLHNNALINVARGKNALVENNRVCDTDVGIAVAADDTVLRGNRFERVTEPIRGKPVINSAERLLAGLSALSQPLPESCAPVMARLKSLAAKPLETPGLDADARSCAAELAKLAAAAPKNGTYPQALLNALFLTGLKIQCNNTRPLADGVGGTLKQWLDVEPHIFAPPFKLTLVFAEHPKYRIGIFEAALTPGKPWGHDLPVALEPGVSTLFRAPLKWTAAGEGWSLSGTGDLAIGGTGSGLPITQWLVCGPFANDEKGKLDKAVRGPERRLDLAAQYDTLAGKKGWDTVHTQKLDFAKLYGPQRSASAFAMVVLRAKKPAPFALVCHVGPGALTLNGEPLLLPRSRQVSGTLKTGDNIFLLKVANAGEAWSADASLSVADGVEPGDVQVLSAEQLKGVAELNPKPMPPIPEGAALPFSGNVEWRLVYADDFDRSRLGTDWCFGGVQNWAEHAYRFSPGEIDALGSMFSYFSYAHPVTLPLRVEYDVKVGKWGNGGALTAATLTPANEVSERRLWGTPVGSGYMLCLGWHNQMSDHLWREAEEVSLRNPGVRLEPGTWHHVVAQFTPPQATLVVDGKVALEYTDKNWLPNLNTFSFFSGFIDVAIDNVRIYARK